MNYSKILDYLLNKLPMFQRVGEAAYKANLDNIIALNKHLGYPETKFKSIHIAGTNGKGSVSHMIASVLQESGLKTGLCTSPHFKDFRERIKVNGIMIHKNYICDFFNDNSRLRLKIISSHLAFADDPRMAHQVGEQVEILDGVSRIFAQAGLKHKKSLANSAAILHSPGAWSDIVRPGIALYGGNPFTGTSCEEKGLYLKQAMKVRAPVLSVHNLPKGRGISYGLTFTAPRDMRVAIIGCGYAHNYSRSLSNRAWMLYKDRRLPVIGRVCMQLTAVDASCVPLIKPGDEVFILGGNGNSSIEVHELSAWWKTVSYEVLCLLGKNEKTYINS